MLPGIHIIQACACLPLYPREVHPSWGSWRLLRWLLRDYSIFQHERGGREAGSPGELIAGHMDQAKSQWAAGDVAAGISFQLTIPT